ncbi:MAG TPA: oligoendopeptidase F [Ignavibacteriaceae bacterium]|jgi:oligoendopeptidase F|nr:MAG: Oligoendopeptidase F, plasmid [Ignavibacteria bacterium ADurb.Bin266]OQY73440.1 MAG: oligoendopeptidase F [Ignavibacteriales bacterium UTCHB2]HQF42831.1 oligoendopeptidase F [Ignavibacteriaceae bacterium]HQI39611.1 oligoendopeptidase F [Ignavibacteriaceae bacterium]
MKSQTINKYYASENLIIEIPTRDQIDEKFKWDLTDIYPDDLHWEKDFKWVSDNIVRYKTFEGRLENSSDLLACLKFNEEIGIKLERLYLYSMLAKDSDMRDTKYQGMDGRVKSLNAQILAASSFIKPEILKIDETRITEMLNNIAEFKIYKHLFNDLLRFRKHTLDKKQEELLAMAEEITQIPYNTYSLFTNADLKFPHVIDEDGNSIEISHSRYYAALYSKDRTYRENAFKAYLSVYMDSANSLSALFNGNIKTNIFYARTRKFQSARESALFKNNIPLSVYDNLVKTVNENMEPMYRWASLKKKLLKLDELHPYDVYVTVFDPKLEKKYPYDQAVKLVLDSLKIMGNDYLDSLNKAFNNRWIDVYETKAKRSGAYSSGTTFGVHPYVLLNWADLLNDVFTLAHEMGHNMHSYYTGLTQPYHYANYSIFLAEVASTFNENLLLDHLINISETKDEKLFLLEKYLNNISATVYRQVMFAEFEMLTHSKVENGEVLTPDTLCKLYRDIYQKYWGDEMVVDEEESYTWARVPHFYYNFYVYQYATGFAASEALAEKVKSEGKTAVKKYLDFLKAGSSDYPIDILKNAGVDMNSPEPILAVTKKMNQIIDEIENLI